MLEVPVDVARDRFPGRSNTGRLPRSAWLPIRRAIRDAARLLLKSARPMIWCGQACFYSQASGDLAAVAEYLAAPVMTTLLGKSAFDETHRYRSARADSVAPDLVRDALERSDAVFAIGASLTRTVFARSSHRVRKSSTRLSTRAI